jgi:hypothetical protein
MEFKRGRGLLLAEGNSHCGMLELEDDFALTCGTRHQGEEEVLGVYRFRICRWAVGCFLLLGQTVPFGPFLFFISFLLFFFCFLISFLEFAY